MNHSISQSRGGFWFSLIHVACMIFVSCYLLFDVLDLDGSQHASIPSRRSQALVAVDNLTDIETMVQPSVNVLQASATPASARDDLASSCPACTLRVSDLKATRRHRVALPRSAVADSSSPVLS
jgi:hypothetical protein